MIKIAGLQKVTLIDYPGHVAATVFLAGCNFRCGYCHNPELVEIKPKGIYLEEKEVFEYFKKRKKLLDGVCISGGEPLLNQEKDLINFLQKIKDLGFLIKLDTNGYNSSLLQKIIEKKLVDYIAMDIKANLGQYQQVTNAKVDLENIKKSIELIKQSGLDYEFRTTVLPKFHNLAAIEEIAKLISGAKNYCLQNFRNRKTLDPAYHFERSFRDLELEKMKQIAEKYVQKCEIRN